MKQTTNGAHFALEISNGAVAVSNTKTGERFALGTADDPNLGVATTVTPYESAIIDAEHTCLFAGLPITAIADEERTAFELLDACNAFARLIDTALDARNTSEVWDALFGYEYEPYSLRDMVRRYLTTEDGATLDEQRRTANTLATLYTACALVTSHADPLPVFVAVLGDGSAVVSLSRNRFEERLRAHFLDTLDEYTERVERFAERGGFFIVTHEEGELPEALYIPLNF